MSLKILFKFASRSRPEKFFRCLDNIHANTKSDNFQVLATLDTDDETMNNESVHEKLKSYPNVIAIYGESKSKIHAINRDLDYIQDWDILINTSDDMWFTEFGFDIEIKNDMLKHFPDLDGVLHYNDGNQKDNVMTMSIIGRKYFDRFKYIYHPSYISLWSDVEAMEVARGLNKIVYMGDDKILFRHMHPAWGLTNWDEQYKKTESSEYWETDAATYHLRKEIRFV